MNQSRPSVRSYLAGVARLPRRVRELEAAVQENRQLNRRIAELTDVVAELLVPATQRDEARLQALLGQYRDGTIAS